MKEGFENWLIVFSIIIVTGVILHFTVPKKDSVEREEVMGVETFDYKYVPYITSVAPLSLKVDEFLEYEVIVSDLDTEEEDIEIYLEEGPDWMYIQESTVEGTPLVAGTYKFIVTVSDGVNSSSQVNYILVEENE